ncbi:hypothetical protein CHS0354_033253 [Potamilus streckersoni]|uniref:Promethin n=1 Tax=Potamilus streckersoni TaxID=2493646 RepID=A0AAE0S6M8_9BIVA|nr:hypothetical protein CHS0354_033253 [Potamilus streckersoni]
MTDQTIPKDKEEDIPKDKEEESDFKDFFKAIGIHLPPNRMFRNAKLYAESHPVAAIFFLIFTIMSSGPLICFVIFVIGSITVTFFGFLFVEGTCLMIAIMMLGGVLVFVFFMALGIFIFIATVIYIDSITEVLLQKITRTFISYLPTITFPKQEIVAKAE